MLDLFFLDLWVSDGWSCGYFVARVCRRSGRLREVCRWMNLARTAIGTYLHKRRVDSSFLYVFGNFKFGLATLNVAGDKPTRAFEPWLFRLR